MQNISEFSARKLADRLLCPELLDAPMHSGVFVQTPSEGASQKFIEDLATTLEARKVCVETVHANELVSEDGLANFARRLLMRFAGHHERCNTVGAPTIASAVYTCASHSPCHIALLLTGVEILQINHDSRVLKALKAARDSVNLEPNWGGRLLFVAACAPPGIAQMFVHDKTQAFYGAVDGTLAPDWQLAGGSSI